MKSPNQHAIDLYRQMKLADSLCDCQKELEASLVGMDSMLDGLRSVCGENDAFLILLSCRFKRSGDSKRLLGGDSVRKEWKQPHSRFRAKTKRRYIRSRDRHFWHEGARQKLQPEIEITRQCEAAIMNILHGLSDVLADAGSQMVVGRWSEAFLIHCTAGYLLGDDRQEVHVPFYPRHRTMQEYGVETAFHEQMWKKTTLLKLRGRQGEAADLTLLGSSWRSESPFGATKCLESFGFEIATELNFSVDLNSIAICSNHLDPQVCGEQLLGAHKATYLAMLNTQMRKAIGDGSLQIATAKALLQEVDCKSASRYATKCIANLEKAYRSLKKIYDYLKDEMGSASMGGDRERAQMREKLQEFEAAIRKEYENVMPAVMAHVHEEDLRWLEPNFSLVLEFSFPEGEIYPNLEREVSLELPSIPMPHNWPISEKGLGCLELLLLGQGIPPLVWPFIARMEIRARLCAARVLFGKGKEAD